MTDGTEVFHVGGLNEETVYHTDPMCFHLDRIEGEIQATPLTDATENGERGCEHCAEADTAALSHNNHD